MIIRQKKQLFVLLLSLFILSAGFAADGVMAGEQNIKVLKTTWFDIIYPPGSAHTAALLAENADSIYMNVTAWFGTEPWFRMPVVITPAQDQFNAYFTTTPYNHIVLFDTVTDSDLAVFSNEILSVFRHELSHAVTYNMKNKFWKTFDRVFGDLYNPAAPIVTTAGAEGASVTSESANNEGRLNDEYSKQMVLQAKLEGRFPNWADIQGAKDKYPATLESYYFGAAFAQWLQDTYGMKKYAEYWYQAVNLKALTYYTSFKTVYGIKIEEAWKKFRDSVSVPDIPANPLANKGYSDLFTQLGDIKSKAGAFSKYNSQGSLYISLTSGENIIAWIDEYSSSVWASKYIGNEYTHPKKLFTLTGINRISLSDDGTYMAVSFISKSGATLRNVVRIYDIKTGACFSVNEKGIRDATIIATDNSYYLAAVKTYSQYADLKIFKLNRRNRRILSAEPIKTVHNPAGDIPTSLIDGGNGNLAYIYKTGMKWSVRIYALGSNSIKDYEVPLAGIVMRNLAYVTAAEGTTKLLFSYTVPDSMPRLGRLEIAESKVSYSLQKNDVSGGIYFPVEFRNNIAYIGKFYRDFRLLSVDSSILQFDIFPSSNSILKDDNKPVEPVLYPQLADAKPYNPLPYYCKGSLLPISPITSKYLHSAGLESTDLQTLGLTYVSSNPWTTDILALSTGYDIRNQSLISALILKGGTQTSLFSYLLQGQVEFDNEGYKQSYNNVQFSSVLPIGNVSTITFNNTSTFFEGRQSTENGTDNESANTAYIYGENDLSAKISTIHKSGPGTFETIGGYITGSYDINYQAENGKTFDSDAIYQNLSAETGFHLPKLLPIVCRYGQTYNLPFSVSATVFPSSAYVLNNCADIVLYSVELQKGIPFLASLYLNRFTLKTGYEGNFKYGTNDSWNFIKMPELTKKLVNGDMQYYDTASLTAGISLTPNIGQFAQSSSQFSLQYSILYRIRPEDEDTKWGMRMQATASY